MKLDQEKSEFLDEMLQYWQDQDMMTSEQAKLLQNSYESKNFDWRRLAQYSFWIAMACGVISLGALLIDKDILSYLKKLYDTPDSIISLLSAAAAGILYYRSFQRRKTHQMQIFSNDALIFTAVMLTANAIAYLGKTIGSNGSHFSLLILLSVLIYGVLAYVFKSRLIWAFVLLSLGAWFGTETGYLSRWNWYFIGLNYPLRFVFFGLLLTATALLLRKNKKFELFYGTTYISGMIYLFISLWLISVFGNYGTLDDWYKVKQLSLFYWGIISAGVCILSIWIGLKYRDDIAREFGITFLFINLYTRYFEYFWDSWHKALFFSVLAASFWIIGQRAEKIWNVEFLKK
ncbi:DUF2157 domain-containing protein [Pedobacter sp. HMWF019]|uniref:DUF2157 domain-containing protein n=1 Tax=Pedobacter sp. HMWF019 TaxID=2056856 RepID=UPI000D335C6C|nr:DUF2157 domain-containing protein [Pedobacter sp. HMWF019]PTT03312.1 DUF2157 domain-containing protein [Pedobacter sp. HMWF019]